MKIGMQSLREKWKILTYEDRTASDRLFMVTWIKLIVLIVTLVIALIEGRYGWTSTMLTAIHIAAFTLINVVISRKHPSMRLDAVVMVLITIVITVFFLRGGAQDYSAFWPLFCSVVILFIVGIKYAAPFCIYYLALIIVIFHTPWGNQLPYQYTENFKLRFPYLFLCVIGISLILVWEMQKSKVQQSYYYGELKQKLEEEKRRMSDISLKVVLSLNNALAAKVPGMNEHNYGVAAMSEEIGQQLGMDKENVRLLYYAGMVHDIGKISLPDELLSRKDISDEEYECYKLHVANGSEILINLQMLEGISNGAKYHHENYDGSGYLYELRGEEIPLAGRIVAVADHIDELKMDGKSVKEIVDYLKTETNKKFDGKITSIAIKILEEKEGKIQ